MKETKKEQQHNHAHQKCTHALFFTLNKCINRVDHHSSFMAALLCLHVRIGKRWITSFYFAFFVLSSYLLL